MRKRIGAALFALVVAAGLGVATAQSANAAIGQCGTTTVKSGSFLFPMIDVYYTNCARNTVKVRAYPSIGSPSACKSVPPQGTVKWSFNGVPGFGKIEFC